MSKQKHNMNTYFSSTDMSELADNAEQHQYYLSLIVNNAMDIVAKVGVAVEQEMNIQGKRTLRGLSGMFSKPFNKTVKETVLEHYNCDIYTYEPEVEDWFKARTKKIIEDAKPKSFTPVGYQRGFEFAQALEPYNQQTVVKFIAKYLAGDLTYTGTVYKALEEIEKNTQPTKVFVTSMSNGFDVFYDDYFEEDGHQLDVISKMAESIDTWSHKFKRAAHLMEAVITDLTTGYEPRQF